MYYAAFGIFANPHTMWQLVGRDARLVGRGTVKDWRFQWRGCADTERAPGEVLEVVVWEIDDNHLARLDGIEGYPHNYTRVSVPVYYSGDEDTPTAYMRAQMYTMVRKGEIAPPGDGMLRGVHYGYEINGLDGDTVIEAAQRAERAWEERHGTTY